MQSFAVEYTRDLHALFVQHTSPVQFKVTWGQQMVCCDNLPLLCIINSRIDVLLCPLSMGIELINFQFIKLVQHSIKMGLVCFAQDNIILSRFINVPSGSFSEFSLQIQVQWHRDLSHLAIVLWKYCLSLKPCLLNLNAVIQPV